MKSRIIGDKVVETAIKVFSDDFSNNSRAYIAPTGNVKEMCDLFDNYGSVLTVLGGGGIALESVLRGARDVDCFDFNPRQYDYFELMLTCMTFFDYEEFCKYFTSDQGKLLSFELYEKMYWFLEDDIADRLKPAFFRPGMIDKYFRTDYMVHLERLKKFCSYYNEEEYYKLKENLNMMGGYLDFVKCDVSEVPEKFADKKYDLIFLDNIFQYYRDIKGLDDVHLVDKFIKKKLSKLLNDDGIIQVNYGFELATDAVIEKFGYDIEGMSVDVNRFVQYEMNNSVNTGLLSGYNGYDVSFISGTESSENDKRMNMVLTYKKQKN